MNKKIYSDKEIKTIRNHLSLFDYKYVTYPKFVFLCGKGFEIGKPESYKTTNRYKIQNYIKKNSPETRIVLSEKLWEYNLKESIDLLTFEEYLCEISDVIVLLVESPGSFCELGAFADQDDLYCKKMIIVIDKKYQHDQSFVLTGPVDLAKKSGAKIVFANLNGALFDSRELTSTIINMLNEFQNRHSSINKRIINKKNMVTISSFILEILEIIKITQPLSSNDLPDLYKTIKQIDTFTLVKNNGHKFRRDISLNYILNLLENAEIINISDGFITLCEYKQVQNFMILPSSGFYNVERNRILCRKYKYGEKS